MYTDYSAGVTVNVGTINGGKGVNTVPGEASADVEVRASTPEKLQDSIDALERVYMGIGCLFRFKLQMPHI